MMRFAGAGLAGLLLFAMPVTGAQAQGGRWSLVSSPNVASPLSSSFADVSCVPTTTTTRCVGVGRYLDRNLVSHFLIEKSMGKGFSVEPTPNRGPRSSFINSVSCLTAAVCVAVGYYDFLPGIQRTLIESWNGKDWKAVASADPGDATDVLNSVSCVSASSCVAVGAEGDTGGPTNVLIESWDGTSWTTTSAASPGSATNVLNGVSCLSSSSCVAVGSQSPSPGQSQVLVEAWDGTAWTLSSAPDPGSATDALNAVSCNSGLSGTLCVAVGDDTNTGGLTQALIETGDGTTWTQAAAQQPGSASDVLNAVSCVSPSTLPSCVAVGADANTGGSTHALVETWDGVNWTTSSPAGLGGVAATLSGVDCLSSGSCTAVGARFDKLTSGITLAEDWNGATWSHKRSATASVVQDGLAGVSCEGGGTCTAVGFSRDEDSVQRTLVERTGGGSWTVAKSPNQGEGPNNLTGVSCFSGAACVAVGSWAKSNSAERTLTEAWNGSAWSVVPSMNVSAGANILRGVSCFAATTCVAVGDASGTQGPPATLVEAWDGSQWSVLASPDPGPHGNSLDGVSCSSATSCVAVGASTSGVEQTLTELWDGTTWTVVPSPNEGTGDNVLQAVSCSASNACTAVGYAIDGSGMRQPLTESWDGAAWTITASLSGGPNGSELNGVSCTSGSTCVAIGTYLSSKYIDDTLIESWDGTAWSVVPSANAPGGNSILLGVSATASGSWDAAGYVSVVGTGTAFVTGTMIERSP
jgi:hypothetical protein